jgi:hypothetical protein
LFSLTNSLDVHANCLLKSPDICHYEYRGRAYLLQRPQKFTNIDGRQCCIIIASSACSVIYYPMRTLNCTAPSSFLYMITMTKRPCNGFACNLFVGVPLDLGPHDSLQWLLQPLPSQDKLHFVCDQIITAGTGGDLSRLHDAANDWRRKRISGSIEIGLLRP